ncbi:MAG: tRNA preQ1(34) S-adenosylmethionine ribosyltransferase-isomerase QueA [Planctomycetota bacterium]
MSYRLNDYDFELPPELIAQEPPEQRRDARLLVYHRAQDRIEHRRFPDLLDYLEAPDHFVLNTTKVIPARAFGVREETQGRAEFLFVAPLKQGEWKVLLRTGGRAQIGQSYRLKNDDPSQDESPKIVLMEKLSGAAWRAQVELPTSENRLDHWLQLYGQMPLPPYIGRQTHDPRAKADRERYQTIYAEEAGAAAAPTAGLHFDQGLMDEAKKRGLMFAEVLLHVGLGTFSPITVGDIRDHAMHQEYFALKPDAADSIQEARRAGGRTVAIGTTSVRTLESAFDETSGQVAAASGDTGIFIYPPQKLRAVDALVTNFHLPKSSLLMLVSAFASREAILRIYAEAVRERYRFFSYGDAMLIL